MQEYWLQQGVLGAVILVLLGAVAALWKSLSNISESRVQLLTRTLETLSDVQHAIQLQTKMIEDLTASMREIGRRGRS